ncbi:zinc-dependent alcohol dehydrogenase [Spelaeicoccus albus]|uniref:L-iditol 2-dehydrogenase n=1 Tax=Spelaeicoccus albus TaxID=1280376 RepID=A0A7Z0AA54_9MICO|nr:alcohol dehydrogenase catalytic domain-containing protein [Spelaeicoccus albus]NYI67249.1 L-iditol 2-dehydrogenase [Spelaeicoccus albus]
MRSLVLTDFDALSVETRPTPEPGDGEVLLRVLATGICGSDVHGYTGENGRRSPGQIMGHESVGRVAARGPDVTEPEIGVLATFNPVVVPVSQASVFEGREQHCPDKTVIGVAPEVPAAFADCVLVPARNIVPLPETMPPHYGALIEPIAVALHAVRRALTPADDRVLVVGGGPIGQSAVVALTSMGVRSIYVSEVDAGRRELCRQLGGTAFDPTSATPAEHLAGHGGPVPVAVDAVGVTRTVDDALGATELGGRVALVGMGSPRLDLDAFRVSTAERTLTGSFTYSMADFRDAARYVGGAPELLAHLISEVVTPDRAMAAFDTLAHGAPPAGKILVDFSEDS